MTRVAATHAAPALHKGLIDLHATVEREALAAGLEQSLLELIRIRASQLNGCAFCVDMHTTAAANGGEDARRLAAVVVWRESGFFSTRERAALELTESMTLLAETRVPDEVYAVAANEFGEAELVRVMWTVTVINAFNRLAVGSGMRPTA